LVVADHGGDPDRGSAEAERLIVVEKVAALYGAYQSSVTEAASAVAERHGIPFVTGEPSSPRLHRRGFKWFFRTGPHDGHYTKVMFDFLKDFQAKRGIAFTSVGILHEDSAFGVDSARVQDDLAAAAGLAVVAKAAYSADTFSLVAEVEGLREAAPDVLLPTSYTNDAILFFENAAALEYQPKMIIAQDAGYMAPAFLEAVGSHAEGIISRAPFALDMVDRIPLIRDMNEIYKKHSGGSDIFDPPARSFVGALVLMEAIDRAGSTEPEAIRQALRDTYIPASQIPMPWFDIKFGPDGQNTGVAAILAQYQDGRYYTIYPFRFAARQVIYPMPAWSRP
jgi:branched-chain amino acid transport system substrate-binding protein